MLEFREYTNGTRIIKATVTMYEMLYRNLGFKPLEANNDNDKGKGNRSNKAKNSTDSPGETTDE